MRVLAMSNLEQRLSGKEHRTARKGTNPIGSQGDKILTLAICAGLVVKS